jgi:hypothetical protein
MECVDQGLALQKYGVKNSGRRSFRPMRTSNDAYYARPIYKHLFEDTRGITNLENVATGLPAEKSDALALLACQRAFRCAIMQPTSMNVRLGGLNTHEVLFVMLLRRPHSLVSRLRCHHMEYFHPTTTALQETIITV